MTAAAKRKEKEKKELKDEKNSKYRKTLRCRSFFDFRACPSHNVVKRDGKKGKLLCCKRIFDWIKANLVEIEPKNHLNVQKMHVLQKAPGVNGLKHLGCLCCSHVSYLLR